MGAACAAGFGADALGVDCDAGLVVLAVRLGGALAECEAEGRADDREVEYDREELRDGPRELYEEERLLPMNDRDRKSTRLNSSHLL